MAQDLIATKKQRDIFYLQAQDMINRQCSSGALFYGKDLTPITYTSTGLKSLDAATGGGIPRGHIVELHGAEGTGKTSLALALAFRIGGPVLYIDADHAASRGTLANIGKRYSRLYLYRPETLESALEMIKTAASGFSAIVLDTLPALPSKLEFTENPPEWAELTRRMSTIISHAMPQIAGELTRSGCTLFIVNQIREKVGVWYGDPYKVTGGHSIGCYAALRMRLSVTTQIKEGQDVMGIDILANVIKAKYTGARKKAFISLRYGQGFKDTKL